MTDDIQDNVPETEPQSAVAVREPDTPLQTPAQARVEAIANVLHNAYEKASTLKLTAEEVAALEAEFPDDAFKPGAAGKENLIYIEHAFLRERLNKVLGLGQWSIITRRTWAEAFRTNKGDEASRIYVEAVMVIRGCFVAEAIGDMDYYPKNQSTNYGDAVEGAKSAALRRLAKELGVGLQAWKKDFCEGWKSRKYRGKSADVAPVSQKPPAKASEAPNGGPDTPGFAERCKAKFIKAMNGPMEPYAWAWAVNNGLIMDTEVLSDGDADNFPSTSQAFEAATAAMETVRNSWTNHQQEVYEKAVLLHEAEKAKKAPAPAEKTGFEVKPKNEPWRSLITPFKYKEFAAGTKLGDIDKKALWFWFMAWQPRPWTDKQGKERPPSQKDVEFRKALDTCKAEVAAKYGFLEPKEAKAESADPEYDPEQVPF